MNQMTYPGYRVLNRVLAVIVMLSMILGLAPSFGPQTVSAASQLLSEFQPVIASSSEGDNFPEGIVDSNINSRWASVAEMDPQWIYVDLGVNANIDRVYLSWETACAKAFQIQVSNDAVNWSSIYSTTTGTGGVNNLTVSGNGRYVRMYGTQRATTYGYSLYEFQVYGTPTQAVPAKPVNIALNKPTYCSTIDTPGWATPGQLDPNKAVDGDNTTRWSSQAWDPQWFYVDLGSVHTIGRVTLSWELAYGKTYEIQVSNDATNWTTVYRQLYGRGAVENLKLYASGRYVRMYGFARGSAYGYSLYEFAVYDYVSGDPIPTATMPPMPVPTIVPVGSGSYKTNDLTCASPTYPMYKTDNIKAPIPSSGWWQSILIKRLSDGVVPVPFRVQYTDSGLSMMNQGAGYVQADGNAVVTTGFPDLYLMASNINAANMSAKVCGYGDWSVSAVLSDDNTYKMKSTFVKGSPYTYHEFTDGSSPYITLGATTRFFDDNNNTILATDGASITADHIGMEVTNVDCGNNTRVRSYGVFAPAGTVFKKVGSKITMQLGSGEKYLSVATLPANSNLNYFYQHAYAFVTDTKVSYNCDDASSIVTTTFNTTTQLKRTGFSSDTIMCLFPHQWKSSTTSLVPSMTYASIRGTLKVHEGNTFATENKFNGIIPQFGEPTGSGGYDRATVVSYINSTITMLENNYMWDDPYWEGKNLHPLTQAVLIADQIGETALRDRCLATLKNILTNWFTYSGGWPNDYPYYFYYSPEWGAMQGDGGNNGMAKWMSDHHYLWGYYIYSAAILGTYDKDFVNKYGGMVDHLIRDIGNPSRTDTMYPFVRQFDVYEGHSWAGGYGDNYNGNNQEATSEALFAYAGQYLWATMMGNKDYRDAAMWVYAVESNAVLQYWFNYDQDNWHPGYTKGVGVRMWGSKYDYATYFSTDPNCYYGIHFLPTAPYMTYFGFRPNDARRVYDSFVREKGSQETGWYHILWPFQALFDPQAAISKWNPDKIAADDNNGKKEWPNTYWFIHAMNAFGTRSSDIRSSNWTTYEVFNKNGVYTAVIWNPTNTTQYAVFRDNTGAIVGTVTVPAMKTVTANPRNGVQPPAATVKAATPTFSPVGGTYNSVQMVAISSATAGATIRYTLDGSTPTASSPRYTAPIKVASNVTIKAKAFKDVMIDSDMATASYVINITNTPVPTPIVTTTPTPVPTPTPSLVLLSSNKTGTASSVVGGNTANMAFDTDNANTRWESATSDPQWIYVDLGTTCTISRTKLIWETASGKDFKIQVSGDATNWTDATTVTGGIGGTNDLTFAAKTGRYVRMYGTARNTGYGYSLWGFEVYGTTGTNTPTPPPVTPTPTKTPTPPPATPTPTAPAGNLALNKTGTASSVVGGNTANMAFDADTVNTRWESAVSDPQWIYVDLGASYSVARVKLTWETASGKDYKIQVSTNATTWTDAATVTGGDGGIDDISFAAKTGRYVRMYGTARNTGYGYSLWGFEVYASPAPSPTPTPVNRALNKTATASSVAGGNLANWAFDGNATGTRWEGNASDPQWIYVDLGATYSITRVKLTWETASAKDYKIQVSTDGTTWTDATTVTGGDGGIDDLTFAAKSGRYVRMYGTARNTGYGYSLWEFEVY